MNQAHKFECIKCITISLFNISLTPSLMNAYCCIIIHCFQIRMFNVILYKSLSMYHLYSFVCHIRQGM